jgi:release factor glutamine methyltransferase
LPHAHVCAVDINPYAAHLTASTFHHNEFSKRTSVIVGDLTTMFRKKGFFDVVLFNPPYVPTEESELGSTDIEASYAGGLDGRVVTDRFLTLVGNVMVVGGMLYLLLIRENKVPEVVQWLQTHLGDTTIVAEKKRGGEHQFIVRCCKR